MQQKVVDNLKRFSVMNYVFDENADVIGAWFITRDGKFHMLNEFQCDPGAHMPLTRDDKYSPTIHEIVQTFNSKDWRDMLNKQVQECKRNIESIRDSRLFWERFIEDNHRNFSEQETIKLYFNATYIDGLISYQQARIEWYNKLLYTSKQVTGKDGEKDFRTLVDRAKAVPITRFVEFNGAGFARCIFHNENTPSMKLYKNNTVYCFGGCGKKADVIDVVRQLHGCNFKEAINILNK